MDSQRARSGSDLALEPTAAAHGEAVPRPAEPRLSVVMPVYNEAENAGPALRRLMADVTVRPIEVLVVYDFEEDSTLPVVRDLISEFPEIRLQRNHLGRGVLNALRSGLAGARAPYVVVTMADLSDDPTDINRMYEAAVAGAAVVAASRYMRGGRQLGGPILKRTLSRAAGLSLHWLTGIGTHDPTSNFKLYSKRLLDQVSIDSAAGFELALELTVKAHRLGLDVAEVPTTWRDRTAGESQFRLRKWLPHYLRWYVYALLGGRRRRQALA